MQDGDACLGIYFTRCGQMLLANSLLKINFPSFEVSHLQSYSDEEKDYYQRILLSFNDISVDSSFGIQNIAIEAIKIGILPGAWFGPSVISGVLRNLNAKFKPFKDVEIFSFNQGVLELYQLDAYFSVSPKAHAIVLLSVRLGIAKILNMYLEQIKSVMAIPYCTGFIGGEENKALYFIGYQDNSFIFLDPHYPQRAFAPSEFIDNYSTYHCIISKTMACTKLNASLAFGMMLNRLLSEECGRLQ